MELTSDNFKDRLSSIREEILECDLIAIDWELTGIDLFPASSFLALFPPPQDRQFIIFYFQ